MKDKKAKLQELIQKKKSQKSNQNQIRKPIKPKKNDNGSLLDKMALKLESSKFRWLNETLYTKPSTESFAIFQKDPTLFKIYHQGFANQAAKWPLNPLKLIIEQLRPLNKNAVVADMGCGEAELALELPHLKVYSFDLFAGNDRIIACDISNVPLEDGSCDVVVFCLSLMGTNFHEFLKEARRILKTNGVLKIAEVVSRIENYDIFITAVEGLGYKLKSKGIRNKMFVLVDFNKSNNICGGALPALKPCLYKKR